MARAVVPRKVTLFALIVPCTLIAFPISSALPGANDVTSTRVLSGLPAWLTPFLFRLPRNRARSWLFSRSANAVGGPQSSVVLLRLPAISSFLLVWYAASTWAAVKSPTGFAAGTTIPAAPSAQVCAGVPATGRARGTAAAIVGAVDAIVGGAERPALTVDGCRSCDQANVPATARTMTTPALVHARLAWRFACLARSA